MSVVEMCDCGRDERRYIIKKGEAEQVVCKLCFQAYEHGVKHAQLGGNQSERRSVSPDTTG
jgi:hypothetical protein